MILELEFQLFSQFNIHYGVIEWMNMLWMLVKTANLDLHCYIFLKRLNA